MLFNLVLSTLVFSANRAPIVTVNQEAEPVLLNYGEAVELPIHLSDPDGDSISLYYKFDDDTKWEQAPMSDRLNVFPGSLFAHLDLNADHTMQLYASDGDLESEPVSFSFFSFFKHIRPSLRRRLKLNLERDGSHPRTRIWRWLYGRHRGRAPPNLVPLLPPPPQKPPDEQQPVEEQSQEVGIPAIVQSLTSNSVDVSYSFDDSGVWSKPVSYPLGDMEVLIPHSDFLQHGVEGTHKVILRFAEEGNTVSEDSLEYNINKEPVIQATNTDTLSLKGVPSGPVTLPLSVMDDDGDEVTLWYRFDGQSDWTYVPAGLGVNLLPAEAFAGREAGSSGYVEVSAYDGYDHSAERLRIGYSIEGDVKENEAFFGTLSPAAFAGIIVGAVAVIALAIAIVVVATRKKLESSSTGLIESE
jgi:hypothetical protein